MNAQTQMHDIEELVLLDSNSTVTKIRSIAGLTSKENQRKVLEFLQCEDAKKSLLGIRALISRACFRRWEKEKFAIQVGAYILLWDGSLFASGAKSKIHNMEQESVSVHQACANGNFAAIVRYANENDNALDVCDDHGRSLGGQVAQC